MATMGNLPKEMLLEIFAHYIRSEGHEEFLRNVPRVCKHWNELSSDSSLWRDVRTYNWNFLLNSSERGLLEHTQSLEIDDDISFYGMDLRPVLKNIRDLKALYLNVDNSERCNGITLPAMAKFCPHLERLLLMNIGSTTTPHDLDEFLSVCGPTLKELAMGVFYSMEAGKRLAPGIAAKCPLLEKLRIFDDAPSHIDELRRGCPKLKELQLIRCFIVTDGRDDILDCGFKSLKSFRAAGCFFNGSDLYSLLKNSVDLEHMELINNKDLVLDNISKIPSDKVRILICRNTMYPFENYKALKDAVWKWRRTLSVLQVGDLKCDINSVLKYFLQDNPNPQLKSLVIRGYEIDCRLFEKLVQKCQNLIHLELNFKEYKGREEIEKALEYLINSKGYDS